jgi:hypothetical protein|tara:strand:- start:48 stop:257 length:210 start_codon:yes stop_codon:yes gene_type:complete
MANFADIKKVILEVAGNPDSGIVREYADKWAEAIVSLDTDSDIEVKAKEGTPFERPTKETRVTKPTETR